MTVARVTLPSVNSLVVLIGKWMVGRLIIASDWCLRAARFITQMMIYWLGETAR